MHINAEGTPIDLGGSQLDQFQEDKVRLRQTSNFQFRVLPLHIRWRGPKIKRDFLATPFQYLFLTPRLAAPCLLFGRETHASTTQSDPLLLPTRNGPCREDGALHWEYLFYRVQHPPP